MERQGIGESLVHRPVTDSLKTLWEGDLQPSDLENIEMGLRAMMVSNKLRVLSVDGDGWQMGNSIPNWYEEPFQDAFLDYEFEDPFDRPPCEILVAEEKGYLEKYVESRFNALALEAVPKGVTSRQTAFEYQESWWKCTDQGRDDDSEVIWEGEWDGKEVYPHLGHTNDAAYLVGIYRAGLDVYSNTPLGKICKEFLFSEWPNKLFASFDKEYSSMVRELRGPGCAIDLPPLTALVLSRASNRNNIPVVIRDLREEYLEDRKELWDILYAMWSADSLREQIDTVKLLSSASENMFKAAFPDRLDALSVGLDVAQLSPSGIASALQKLRAHDSPNSKVRALSFAHKLSQDFREQLMTSRKALKKHLTLAEYHDFGLS